MNNVGAQFIAGAVIIGGMAVAALVLDGADSAVMAANRKTIRVKIGKPYVKNNIFHYNTDSTDPNYMVLQNKNDRPAGKMNSAEIDQVIKEGKTYEIDVVGLRNQSLDRFPNIIAMPIEIDMTPSVAPRNAKQTTGPLNLGDKKFEPPGLPNFLSPPSLNSNPFEIKPKQNPGKSQQGISWPRL